VKKKTNLKTRMLWLNVVTFTLLVSTNLLKFSVGQDLDDDVEGNKNELGG
jgi:hypothetical protein